MASCLAEKRVAATALSAKSFYGPPLPSISLSPAPFATDFSLRCILALPGQDWMVYFMRLSSLEHRKVVNKKTGGVLEKH